MVVNFIIRVTTILIAIGELVLVLEIGDSKFQNITHHFRDVMLLTFLFCVFVWKTIYEKEKPNESMKKWYFAFTVFLLLTFAVRLYREFAI